MPQLYGTGGKKHMINRVEMRTRKIKSIAGCSFALTTFRRRLLYCCSHKSKTGLDGWYGVAWWGPGWTKPRLGARKQSCNEKIGFLCCMACLDMTTIVAATYIPIRCSFSKY